MRIRIAVALAVACAAGPAAQEVPLEYQVKAAFVFNFTRFAEWPPAALDSGPFTICVARTNPFGRMLQATIEGESVGGRPLATRVVDADVAGCHVLFVPRDAPAAVYLKLVGTAPTLTVGEAPGFLDEGGIINFVLVAGRVRFEIDQRAAERSQIKLSARLLQLAVPAPARDGD